jgi:hypothetical protein
VEQWSSIQYRHTSIYKICTQATRAAMHCAVCNTSRHESISKQYCADMHVGLKNAASAVECACTVTVKSSTGMIHNSTDSVICKCYCSSGASAIIRLTLLRRCATCKVHNSSKYTSAVLYCVCAALTLHRAKAACAATRSVVRCI